jgi:hypothetical protein
MPPTSQVSLVVVMLVAVRVSGVQRDHVESWLTSLGLVVHAIKEGRQVGEEVDRFLIGSTRLPHQGGMATRSWIPPPVSAAGNVREIISEERPGGDAEAIPVAA